MVEKASNVRGDADLVLFRRCHEVILLPGAHCGPVIQTKYSNLTLPRFEFAYIWADECEVACDHARAIRSNADLEVLYQI